MRKPDFDNLLAVLAKEKPARPTLFEFFMNPRLYKHLTGWPGETPMMGSDDWHRLVISAFQRAGYDYATLLAGFHFPKDEVAHASTVSLNEGVMITDRESFKKYPWPTVDLADYAVLDRLRPDIPDGMKIIAFGPCGVLENVIALTGYDNLCFMLADDPALVREIFDHVGSRLLRHYEIVAAHELTGACISNDDWGFKTQTMLSTGDMRQYVIPWHRKIAQVVHGNGKPVILHSCGNLERVMDDIIDDIGYDGKHSYEDSILPVEEAYEQYGGRIAILGGIDVDFLCRQSPEAIRGRAAAMLARSAANGGYALGSGNSIPAYVPDRAYYAMIAAAVDRD